MAEFISSSTKFYEDTYVQSLPPTDKLLFKYLLDGPSAEPVLGIFELSLNTMAFHTGLDKENIEHTLNRFATANKVHYVDGWVIMVNHFKHNPIKGNSKLLAGALRRFDKVPWTVRDRVLNKADTLYIPYLDPMHTLYIGLEAPSNTALHVPSRPSTNTSLHNTPPTPKGGTSRANSGTAGAAGQPGGGVRSADFVANHRRRAKGGE